MAGKGPHCSFVLLAEFDIDSGAQLTYQFPQPLGTDEGWVSTRPASKDVLINYFALVCWPILCSQMEQRGT
jgi:hypothetical protein